MNRLRVCSDPITRLVFTLAALIVVLGCEIDDADDPANTIRSLPSDWEIAYLTPTDPNDRSGCDNRNADVSAGTCAWRDFYGCEDLGRLCFTSGGATISRELFVDDQLVISNTVSLYVMPMDGSDGVAVPHPNSGGGWAAPEIAAGGDGRLYVLVEDPDFNRPNGQLLMTIDVHDPLAAPTLVSDLAVPDPTFPQALAVAESAGFATLVLDDAIGADHTRVDLDTGAVTVVMDQDVPIEFRGMLANPNTIVTDDGAFVVPTDIGFQLVDAVTFAVREQHTFPIDGYFHTLILTNRGYLALRVQDGGGGDQQYVWLGDGSQYELVGEPHEFLPGAGAATFRDGYYWTWSQFWTPTYRMDGLYRTSTIQPS